MRFNSILVANRGEIACRIMQTAQFMGIKCIAVFVDADNGEIGGNRSQEFHVIADSGEDDLLLDESTQGMNVEIAKIKYGETERPVNF